MKRTYAVLARTLGKRDIQDVVIHVARLLLGQAGEPP